MPTAPASCTNEKGEINKSGTGDTCIEKIETHQQRSAYIAKCFDVVVTRVGVQVVASDDRSGGKFCRKDYCPNEAPRLSADT